MVFTIKDIKDKVIYPEIITREYIDSHFLGPDRLIANVLNGTMFYRGQNKNTLKKIRKEAQELLAIAQGCIDDYVALNDIDMEECLISFLHQRYILEKGIKRLPYTILESIQRK